MESSPEIQMDGINNSEVYDVFHPTPVSLKDLSAIAVSLGIWRYEVMQYLREDKFALRRFNPEFENVSSKSVLPDLPSVIHATIDKYVKKFGFSMGHWLRSHHERVFYPPYYHRNSILRFFKDFVCDYYGTIDYVRTAERMMNCDQFNVQQKFTIACTYFFEDDIRRLWPLVSSDMDLSSIDFHVSPQLYYWICCLNNELHKIPIEHGRDKPVEEIMLEKSMTHNRPSVEYFWNRIPTENRKRSAYRLFQKDVLTFARYILPKLDDQRLYKFVNEDGFEMMHALYRNPFYDKEFVLSIWMRIRNIMNENAFTKESYNILRLEKGERFNVDYYDDYIDDGYVCIRKNWLNLCCEIWNSAPETLKRSAVRKITSDNILFGVSFGRVNASIPTEPKEYTFLLTLLCYATLDERRMFWSNCWEYFIDAGIAGTRRQDVQKIMNLCFENQDEITQFKENVMTNSDRVRSYLRRLLLIWRFEVLNDWVSFLFSNVQAGRNFKQKLLRENFLDRDDNVCHLFTYNVKYLNRFIDDAFANADLSANFKNQLMSLPSTQEYLSRNALNVPSKLLIELIDTLALAEDTLQQIKARIIDALKEKAAADKSVLSKVSFTSVLSWCLGSIEEVEKFKMNY